MTPTQGPDELLFKRFHAKWESIVQNVFEIGDNHEEVALVQDTQTQVNSWAEKSLEEIHDLMDDYREFLELPMNFLGGTSSKGIYFLRPLPMYYARWMSKEIYFLKVCMFVDNSS